MTRRYAVAAALVLALLLGGSFLAIRLGGGASLDDCRAGGTVAGGAIGGPFELIDEDGRVVTDREVIDRPTLIYFGYAFCPDVCPLDNARNAEATELLAERGIEARPVFVSVDPGRDTPEILRDYTANLHPEMLGLTGSREQLRAAADAYRVFYAAQAEQDGDYLVDHTTFTYLMLPETGFVDFFRRDEGPEAVAERVACYIGAGAD